MKRDKVAVCDLCAMEQQDAQERYDKAMELMGDISTPAKLMEHFDEMLKIASGLNK